MRKLVVVLLCCLIVMGCKKNEPLEVVVENSDGTTGYFHLRKQRHPPLPPP